MINLQVKTQPMPNIPPFKKFTLLNGSGEVIPADRTLEYHADQDLSGDYDINPGPMKCRVIRVKVKIRSIKKVTIRPRL